MGTHHNRQGPPSSERPFDASVRATRSWRHEIAICALLVIAVALLYAPVARYGFVDFDDPQYVSENVHVRAGLTWQSIVWAFTNFDNAIWDPLTWLSHQLDAQLFGIDGVVLGLPAAGWHHLTNVALHALAAVLVFVFLRVATGALWLSAFVAGFFALHPQRVESVAWIAERKDVLSGVFGFAALIAYVQWTRQPSRKRLALVLALFALGLLSKPTLVTWPFVMLLLDYWPLRRLTSGAGEGVSPSRIVLKRIVEKLPYFAMAAAIAVVTMIAERPALKLTAATSFLTRLENSFVSCAAYLRQTFWPGDLAVFYPYRASIPLIEVAGATALITSVTVVSLLALRRRPALAVGWLWFLGTLVPVIGLVQVGTHARADRFTYVPAVGLFAALAWLTADVARLRPKLRPILAGFGIVALGACAIASARQVRTWENSETLFRRACEVTTDNGMAHNALGKELAKRGRNDEALREFETALKILPNFADARESYGEMLARTNDMDGAIREFRRAVQADPRLASAHNRLGCALLLRGEIDEAVRSLRESLRLEPGDAEVHNNLASAFAHSRRPDKAIAEYEEALRLQPDLGEAHFGLGKLRAARGENEAALRELRAAASLEPKNAEFRKTLQSFEARAGVRTQH